MNNTEKITKLCLIVAKSIFNVIGYEGNIPWYVPEDMEHFKNTTLHNPVIMGRKTFESIMIALGKPLPNRFNIVITSNKDYKLPVGVARASSLAEALTMAEVHNIGRIDPKAFVIGGESLYREALPIADELHITEVDTEVDGDTFFPVFDREAYKVIEQPKRHSVIGCVDYTIKHYVKL